MKQLSQVDVEQVAGGDSPIPFPAPVPPSPFPIPDPVYPQPIFRQEV